MAQWLDSLRACVCVCARPRANREGEKLIWEWERVSTVIVFSQTHTQTQAHTRYTHLIPLSSVSVQISSQRRPCLSPCTTLRFRIAISRPHLAPVSLCTKETLLLSSQKPSSLKTSCTGLFCFGVFVFLFFFPSLLSVKIFCCNSPDKVKKTKTSNATLLSNLLFFVAFTLFSFIPFRREYKKTKYDSCLFTSDASLNWCVLPPPSGKNRNPAFLL